MLYSFLAACQVLDGSVEGLLTCNLLLRRPLAEPAGEVEPGTLPLEELKRRVAKKQAQVIAL